MGQIFHACAFDASDKTCCVLYADKFHANCFSYSGAVLGTHYLLRQKPYNVMWGGDEVVDDDYIANNPRLEYLLGISTYLDKGYYEPDDEDLDDFKEKAYYAKIDFLSENSKLWEKLNVQEVFEAGAKYFDWSNNFCVKYSGYLLNHTQKLAVNLADYFEQSKSMNRNGDVYAIDAIPVLTETGNGSMMAFFNGISAANTDELVGAWCADLLQITEELPENYKLLNCCFAEIWDRTRYCYHTFGIDEDSMVVCNDAGKPLEIVGVTVFGKRGSPQYVKVERTKKGIKFVTEPVKTV